MQLDTAIQYAAKHIRKSGKQLVFVKTRCKDDLAVGVAFTKLQMALDDGELTEEQLVERLVKAMPKGKVQ